MGTGAIILSHDCKLLHRQQISLIIRFLTQTSVIGAAKRTILKYYHTACRIQRILRRFLLVLRRQRRAIRELWEKACCETQLICYAATEVIPSGGRAAIERGPPATIPGGMRVCGSAQCTNQGREHMEKVREILCRRFLRRLHPGSMSILHSQRKIEPLPFQEMPHKDQFFAQHVGVPE